MKRYSLYVFLFLTHLKMIYEWWTVTTMATTTILFTFVLLYLSVWISVTEVNRWQQAKEATWAQKWHIILWLVLHILCGPGLLDTSLYEKLSQIARPRQSVSVHLQSVTEPNFESTHHLSEWLSKSTHQV